MKRVGSVSRVQLDAQSEMLESFGKMIQKDLQPNHEVPLDGASVNVDGYGESDQEIVFVECWAHVGKVKAAHKHKIAADILKLSLASASSRLKWQNKAVKCYLVFVDNDAAKVLHEGTWIAAAAREYKVTAEVVTLGPETIEKIRRTQKDQDLRVVEPAIEPLE